MTLLADATAVSTRIAATASRLEKGRELADFLRRLEPDEIAIAVAWLTGETRQGKLGVAYSAIHAAGASAGATLPVLTLGEVDAAFAAIAALKGKGAGAERAAQLASLFGRATKAEQDFLARLIVGELRQGALKGLMTEAIAIAAGVPVEEMRRAAMSAGGLEEVAVIALAQGSAGLARLSVQLMRPVLPMLSQSAEDIGEALNRLKLAAFEWKLDGARVQVHKSGSQVRIYTRNLNDVTARVPEIVEALAPLAADSFILDGEAIALRPDGRPHAFQTTMRRFGRKLEVESMRKELPLSALFFDCLLRDGEPIVGRPAEERFAVLCEMLPAALVMPRIVTSDIEEATRFFDEALSRGHEGVMAKALTGPYESGRRGAGWLKMKRANTLDLIVLAAEWGNGRRQGWLSNLHLGARDPSTGGHVMLGKTFKGMSDAMLEWQTREFQKIEARREGVTVYLRPEIVVEVAFNEVQQSSQYPGGFALRFARVKAYRPDKRPGDADTIDTVRRIYESQDAPAPPLPDPLPRGEREI